MDVELGPNALEIALSYPKQGWLRPANTRTSEDIPAGIFHDVGHFFLAQPRRHGVAHVIPSGAQKQIHEASAHRELRHPELEFASVLAF